MSERFDPAPILSQLKDFQRDSVDHAFEQLYEQDASRFLVADEVGLGKTMVARGVIAKAIEHLWDSVERIDVIYICSNSSIAQQNIRRLNVIPDQGFSFSSRMTMIAREVAKLEGNKINFVSFTPGTSFELKSSTGVGDERVLLYWLMSHVWTDGLMDADGSAELLRCAIGETNWPGRLRNGRLDRSDVDAELLANFALDLEAVSAFEVIDRLRHAYAAGEAGPAENAERDALVGSLRQRLASRCVTSLEPDLVILDEFQRFRNLMDSEDAAGSLAAQLFDHDENKTLLLSATPYKMFTGGNDEEDDHHRDFSDTVRFLFDGRHNRFDESMAEYRGAMLDVHRLSPEELRTARKGVEDQLRKVMTRTERLGAGGDRNGMLTEVASNVGLDPRDVATFVGMERLGRSIDAQTMLPHWKSIPSFLNFSDGYKADEQLAEALADPSRTDVDELARNVPMKVDWDRWRRFEPLDTGNARQAMLHDQTIDSGAWKMLWLAPSLPYHELGEPWAGELSSFTKRLIFSSYVGVPKAVSSLLSYEAERRMFGLRAEPIENRSSDRNTVRGLLQFRMDANDRPGAMNSFSFVYPSTELAKIGDPLGVAQERGALGGTLSVDEVRSAVRQAVVAALSEVEVEFDSAVVGEDARWYWAAPLLLDRAAGQTTQMGYKRLNSGAWLDASVEDGEQSGGRSNDLFIEHLRLAKAMYLGQVPLGPRPRDLADVVTDLALGAPATVALRSLTRVFGSQIDQPRLWWNACQIGWAFRSLMNLPDVNSMVRSANWEQDFWRTALAYNIDGCLTAVLDEFFHVLRDSLGLFSIEPDNDSQRVAMREFSEAACEAISTRTASLVARDHLGESDSPAPRFRTRYAMRFGNARAETDQSTATAASVRRSFNSPFWPFVLTSTSVGQEGLDFHLYCHAIVHWNLPGNPVDLEQREGRVHRFKGHAIRRNVAAAHGAAGLAAKGDPWAAMFDAAVAERAEDASELVPFWIYPGAAKIERHVPLLPLSREVGQLARLKRDVARYRLVFGQPRQDDLLEYLGDIPEEKAAELRIDLSPISRARSGVTEPTPNTERTIAMEPTQYPNPRGDDPWDNDAVHFLLDQEAVSAVFKRGPLMECLRRQMNRLETQPDRVEEAKLLAARFGVRQIECFDQHLGKTVVRLVRTDADAPTYPDDRSL